MRITRTGADARPLALLVVSVCGLTACRTTGLDFVRDDRVAVVAPRTGELTGDDVSVVWELRPGRAPLAAGDRFAVFADRAAVAPGESFTRVVERADGSADPACTASGNCLDEAHLASRGLYLTTATDVLVRLPFVEHTTSRSVTIVVVGADGRRKGEAAWSVTFFQKATT
jgi:hypothetical protein